jgi:hypothetical protein
MRPDRRRRQANLEQIRESRKWAPTLTEGLRVLLVEGTKILRGHLPGMARYRRHYGWDFPSGTDECLLSQNRIARDRKLLMERAYFVQTWITNEKRGRLLQSRVLSRWPTVRNATLLVSASKHSCGKSLKSKASEGQARNFCPKSL